MGMTWKKVKGKLSHDGSSEVINRGIDRLTIWREPNGWHYSYGGFKRTISPCKSMERAKANGIKACIRDHEKAVNILRKEQGRRARQVLKENDDG